MRKKQNVPKLNNPWERPKPLSRGDDEVGPLLAAVGKALSNWEFIENLLANLFTVFVGAEISRDTPAPAVRAYGTITGFRVRLNMVDAAATGYFELNAKIDGQRERWVELKSSLVGASERRNDIAHGSAELLVDLTEEKTVGFFLKPGLYVSKRYKDGPAYKYTAAQVEEFANKFGTLANEINVYTAALRGKRRIKASTS